MKKMTILLFFCSFQLANGQSSKPQSPSVQDLRFLEGKWEITFEIYDTHIPDSKPIFTEIGMQECAFELLYNDVPMYLTCEGELVINETDHAHSKGLGRKREIMETIRYSKFAKSFERVGLYSNWPSTGIETLAYDSAKRMIIIRGQLNVQDNMLERYVDTYRFNEDFTVAERVNIANFSDMPINEYGLTLKAQYRKIE